eukprot:10838819-Ditylum_brightwellii.AAC.1
MSEIMDTAKSPLEHLFDNHEFCGTWCKQRLQRIEQKQAAQQYYQCKTKGAKLYAKLLELPQEFTTKKTFVKVATHWKPKSMRT